MLQEHGMKYSEKRKKKCIEIEIKCEIVDGFAVLKIG